MNIRLGRPEDVDGLAELYDELNDFLATGVNYPGWKKGVYPTRAQAQAGLDEGCLFVAREGGELIAGIILNHRQEDAYTHGSWSFSCRAEEVLVVHTLAVRPAWVGRGVGAALLGFARQHAKKLGCRAIRLDTYSGNTPAQKLYKKCGYRYAGTVDLGLGSRGLNAFYLYELVL